MYNSYYEKILATGEVKCIDEEIPFEIPESWEWVRFSTIINLLSGRDLEANQYNSDNKGIPYMTGASNFSKGELLINRWTQQPVTISHWGDLLITCKGTIGEMAYNRIGDIHIARQIMAISPKYVEIEYVQIYLSTLISKLNAEAKSIIPGISRENILNAIVSLPPIDEQKRIIQKVTLLYPCIEKYKIAKEEYNVLEENLIGNIKKSILQEAIQGKLVAQCDTDEPATELLKRIHEEKLNLVKQGKLKKKDVSESTIFRSDDNRYYEKVGNEMVCIDDELPFDIPQTWTWINIGALFYIQTGASFKKEQANSMSKGVRILRGGNISPDYYSFKDDDIFIDESIVTSSILLRKNDLITPAVTSLENVGKMARVLEDYDDVSAGGFVFILRPHLNNEVHSQYLCAAIQSPYLTNKIKSITKKSGSAFYNIGKERLVKLYLPLPPLAEQSRIVNALNSVLKSIEG